MDNRTDSQRSNSLFRRLPEHDHGCRCEACDEVREENRLTRSFVFGTTTPAPKPSVDLTELMARAGAAAKAAEAARLERDGVIFALRMSGATLRAIAEVVGLSPAGVDKIVKAAE